MNDWQKWLAGCRENFGAAPRKFSPWALWFDLRIPKPEWLEEKRHDRLNTLFWRKKALLRDGIVVWGHIIQANNLLFQADRKENCPGEFVYTLRDLKDPMILQEIAGSLADLKGTNPSVAEAKRIADYLTNERIRVLGLPVPDSISHAEDCLISTSFFVRKHIPKRGLRRGLMPIIASLHEPHVVLPLPMLFWPKEFLEFYDA